MHKFTILFKGHVVCFTMHQSVLRAELSRIAGGNGSYAKEGHEERVPVPADTFLNLDIGKVAAEMPEHTEPFDFYAGTATKLLDWLDRHTELDPDAPLVTIPDEDGQRLFDQTPSRFPKDTHVFHPGSKVPAV